MVMSSGEKRVIVPLSLFNEGKPEMPRVVPNFLNSSAAVFVQTTKKLSGLNIISSLIDVKVLPEEIFQSRRLYDVPDLFLSSMNSELGSPTTGEGSANISSITTS